MKRVNNLAKKTKGKFISKRKATPEEREYFEKMIQKEQEKYARDSKCGGVDEGGYVRLHYR